MATSFINEPTIFTITGIDSQSPIAIESHLVESRQQLITKKRRKLNNNLGGSASTMPEASYNSAFTDSYITYTESVDATSNKRDKILTKFPELNLAAIRLEKLSPQIDSKTLHTTFKLLAKLFETSRKNDLWWNLPLVNVGFDSEVLLEWWNKDRKLDFEILGSNIDYIKVWGADIDNEMEDGSITINESELISLWKWITN